MVQILVTGGQVVHLFERDNRCNIRAEGGGGCSRGWPLDRVREALYGYALARRNVTTRMQARSISRQDQTLLLHRGQPAHQVEHTITEVITGRDLVQAQIRIAEGHPLSNSSIGISSGCHYADGCAIQCRITTEDPVCFMPDTEDHDVSSGRRFVRLDSGTVCGRCDRRLRQRSSR